jgi:signal transduction histidine kinase
MSQSTLAMPRRGSALLAALLVATVAAVIWNLKPDIHLVAYNVIGLGCASALVVAFSELAVRERTARVEIERLNLSLQQANAELAKHTLQAEELAALAERNRLAREIHDGLGHYLTVIHVQLEAARAIFDRDRVRALDAVAKASRLTQEGLQDVRQSVAALRAPPALRRSLTEAMTRLAEESRSAGLDVDLAISGVVVPAPPAVELAVFRAAQEGLTNARRHAHAATARLGLAYEKSAIRLTVTDEGRGASIERASGFGLAGLKERMQLLGGEVRIETSPGEGFALCVRVPIAGTV